MTASDTKRLASWLHLGLRAAQVAPPHHMIVVREAKASLLPLLQLLLWLLHLLLLHATVVVSKLWLLPCIVDLTSPAKQDLLRCVHGG